MTKATDAARIELPEIMPGTVLVLHDRGISNNRELVHVKRRTPTRIVIAGPRGEWTFSARSLHEIGDEFRHPARLSIPRDGKEIESVIDEQRRRRAFVEIGRTQWSKLPTDVLAHVLAVLERHAAQSPPATT